MVSNLYKLDDELRYEITKSYMELRDIYNKTRVSLKIKGRILRKILHRKYDLCLINDTLFTAEIIKELEEVKKYASSKLVTIQPEQMDLF